jgi:hypothetical protein
MGPLNLVDASASEGSNGRPGIPFSLVFRSEPGREDLTLKVASAYQAASKRRVSPPAFGPVPGEDQILKGGSAHRAAERNTLLARGRLKVIRSPMELKRLG